MKLSKIVLALLSVLSVASMGCTMCSSPDLESFTATGGSWERTDPTHGRVGSVFAPAGQRRFAATSSIAQPIGSDVGTYEQLPPGDATAIDPNNVENGDEDEKPSDDAGDGKKPKKDLRDLELEDIEVLRRQADPATLPEA